MRMHACWLGVFALVLVLLAGSLTGSPETAAGAGGPKSIMPEAAFSETVKEALQNIQGALDSKPNEKSTPALVRTNALMIAAAAQDNINRPGADVKQLATIRLAALKLAEASQKKKFNLEEAKRQAAILGPFPNITADPAAKTDMVSLKEQFDIGNVMNVFDKKNKGGQGIEIELLTLEQQKKPYTPRRCRNTFS